MNELLSPRDAGHRLGVTTSRVIQLARSGRLPEIRDSAGRRLFLREDVEQLVRERELAVKAQRPPGRHPVLRPEEIPSTLGADREVSTDDSTPDPLS